MSLLYDLADASATEIAMIGKEGLLGIAVFMGGVTHFVVHSRSELEAHCCKRYQTVRSETERLLPIV
jgi:hypothetical protein